MRFIRWYVQLQNYIGEGSASFSLRLFILQLTATGPVSLFIYAFMVIPDLFRVERTSISGLLFFLCWLLGTLLLTTGIWFGQSKTMQEQPEIFEDYKVF